MGRSLEAPLRATLEDDSSPRVIRGSDSRAYVDDADCTRVFSGCEQPNMTTRGAGHPSSAPPLSRSPKSGECRSAFLWDHRRHHVGGILVLIETTGRVLVESSTRTSPSVISRRLPRRNSRDLRTRQRQKHPFRTTSFRGPSRSRPSSD